uniref:LrgB-like protein n=2 Tax=Kalmanozyma brasiliensis (strain GHG001) TaxID=1365824 RepID=V5EUR0_KALBG
MDRAPFRFPSPVLAMLLLFFSLLLLDFLSTKRVRGGESGLKGLLRVLEAPCDFCLRYMSVMFTPSFILIPAREIIGGREIGLLTGWFAASQLAGMVFPVLLHRGMRWGLDTARSRLHQRKQAKLEQERKVEEQRRASVATLVAVMSNINAVPTASPTKEVHPSALNSIATGLSGMTAIATAPLQLNVPRVHPRKPLQLKIQTDAQRHLDHVALETARQQGDPFALAHTPVREHYPHSPSMPHTHRLKHSTSGYFPRGRRVDQLQGNSRSATLSPTRVRARPSSGNDTKGAKGRLVRPGSALRNESARRPQSATDARAAGRFVVAGETTPAFDEYIFQARQEVAARRGSAVEVDPKTTDEKALADIESGPATLVMPTRAASPVLVSEKAALDDGRPSKSSEVTVNDLESHPTSTGITSAETAKDDTVVQITSPIDPSSSDTEPETDAIDRLITHIWASLPWLVTLVTLIVGLPVFYLLHISLPLFLAINILTFLFSISIVPPRIRRFAHPILTTSLLTVFILWGLGAARGWSLRQTLLSYSVDAKYTVLWSLSGYTGPVIGAGDVLFSTLDAGIVSLAIPMYRYRADLRRHFASMFVILTPCAMLSLFLWPTVAAAIGIAPERALAFASRFMSTPLAIELSLTIGADESITVVLVVITGILISIVKDPFFRLLRLDPTQDGDDSDSDNDVTSDNADKASSSTSKSRRTNEDYLTIGIAMGSTAGAIGASSLISKPRCMAVASLSFVLFGGILLVLAAIPQIVEVVRMLAGAPAAFVAQV